MAQYIQDSVQLRDYQKIGLVTMCRVPKMCLGDSTGLGKTLQTLGSIGTIWEREPDYVPIILTTKSALFQWQGEVNKFMQHVEAIVVHGEPYARHQIYEEFFQKSDKKRLLLMTYDTLFRDVTPSVIKDKSIKIDPKLKKQLKEAKAEESQAKDIYEKLLVSIKEISDGRRFEDSEYIFARLNFKSANKPPGWSDSDERMLLSTIKAKQELSNLSQQVASLNHQVNPPKRSSGIQELMLQMKETYPTTQFMLVMDEAHKVKNYRSQVHEKVRAVSLSCERIVGMTATPVKNRLMEFFGLFRIINPALFPKVTAFQSEYCVTKLQRVAGGRQVPIVVGYKNLDSFVKKIEPFYLARQKHDVAKELPELITVEIPCELTNEQDDLYDMAEAGMTGNSVDDGEENSADILSSMTMCAQAVNAPELILDAEGNPFSGPSSKIEALLDLLTGDAEDQKVIVFSRFEKMISVIERHLQDSKIKYVRITGKESDPKLRQKNREIFQDPESGVNVIMITMAGSESLNLQAAEHFVFIDSPWSFGDYVQLVGRMIRIGSSHKTVVAHHMLGLRQSGEKTIDHHVLKALREKKKLSDKVAGESLVGGLQFKREDVVQDILASMREGNKATAQSPDVKSSKSKAPPKAKKSQEVRVTPKIEEPAIESVSIDFSDI